MNSLLTGEGPLQFFTFILQFVWRILSVVIYIARTLVQQAVTVMKENGVEQVSFLHHLSTYPSIHLNRVLSPRYL